MEKSTQKTLLLWYKKNKRPLPWRETKDPYKIWISETMLQQTTSTAVIPFYKKFLLQFPDLKSLAAAKDSDVLACWAGLGYYSRAKNLKKAAQIIYSLKNFPENYTELIKLPGIGAYTSRAVSSIAFSESVGVVDGNIIRFFSRFYNLNIESWTSLGKKELQTLADLAVKNISSKDMNQSLMEIGATICLPKSAKCILCPVLTKCLAHKNNTIELLPTKRPKINKEIWSWSVDLHSRLNRGEQQVALTQVNHSPFLKEHWVLPGYAEKLSSKNKKFDFKHFITKYEILVTVNKKNKIKASNKNIKWVNLKDLSQWSPSSLIKKSVQFFLLILSLGLLPQCQTKDKTSKTKPSILKDIPSRVSHLLPERLTQKGGNFFPQFYESNNFVYVHRKSSKAQNEQVYQFDIKTSKSKKITHQSGSIASPIVINKKLYYISTTDEEKENSSFLKKIINPGHREKTPSLLPSSRFYKFNNFEIYSSNLNGQQIKRLSHKPGFDGFLQPHLKTKSILYSHVEKNNLTSTIKQLFLKTKKHRLLWNSNFVDFDAQLSKNKKKIIFVRWSKDLQTSQLYIHNLKSKKSNLLKIKGDLFFHPIWLQDNDYILFSSNSSEQDNIELYLYSFSRACLSRLTYNHGMDLWPSLNPEEDLIIYSNNHLGNFDIYKSNFNKELYCIQSK